MNGAGAIVVRPLVQEDAQQYRDLRLAKPDHHWFGAICLRFQEGRRLYDSFGFRQFGLAPDAILHEGGYCAKQLLQLFLVSDHPNEQPIS